MRQLQAGELFQNSLCLLSGIRLRVSGAPISSLAASSACSIVHGSKVRRFFSFRPLDVTGKGCRPRKMILVIMSRDRIRSKVDSNK